MGNSKFLKSKKIKLLKKYFEKEKSVILAFLFGSFAKGFEMKESDVDIAIYFKDYNPIYTPFVETKRPKKISELQRRIFRELNHILEINVDLICLNEAPAPLVSAIFKTGIPLKIADKKLYWELYLRKSLEAEDFLGFVEDFWKIKYKAKSLAPEEKERLRIRLDYLKEEMGKIDRFEKMTLDDYKKWEERKIADRWTECIINVSIDIAKMVLASEKKKIPQIYSDALFDFGILIGLGEKGADELAEFADLRNILAHEYLEVIYGRIQNFIKECPKFYEKIFDFLEKYLEKK